MLSASPSSPPTSIASVTSTSSSSRTPTTGSCAWYNPFCYFTTSSSTAVPLMVTPPNSVNYTPLLPSTIQTQGSCGGCWAISASLASTAALYIKYRTMPSVCATDVIACAPNSYGCDGGWPSDAYSYLATLGSSVWRSEGCDEDYDGLEDALDGYGRGEVCAVLQYEEGYVMDTTEEEEVRGIAEICLGVFFPDTFFLTWPSPMSAASRWCIGLCVRHPPMQMLRKRGRLQLR